MPSISSYSVGAAGSRATSRHLELEELVPRVAERAAGGLVDRDVAHRLRPRRRRARPIVDGLADECRLDQVLCDGHNAVDRTIVCLEVQGPALDLFLELAAIPSPPGEERAVADAVLRYLRDLGLEPDEDDAGPAIGSTMGNIYVAARADRRGRAALPLRASRHRAADRRDRAGRRGRRRAQRAAARSSAATTRPRSPRCSRRRGACSPRTGRTPGSSSSSRRRRRSACSAPTPSTTRACARRSATSTTRPRRSARSSSARRRPQPLEVTFHGRAAHAGHVPGGGPLGDRGRGARDRRDAARPDRRGDDRERRRRSAAARRRTSSPSGARSSPRRARTTSAKLADLVQ